MQVYIDVELLALPPQVCLPYVVARIGKMNLVILKSVVPGRAKLDVLLWRIRNSVIKLQKLLQQYRYVFSKIRGLAGR